MLLGMVLLIIHVLFLDAVFIVIPA